MRVLKFQTRYPTGQVEQLSIESERVLIGSGAHCEIRLPLDQARVEHVLLEAHPQGVFVRALSFEPPPTINNVPFTQAPLPAGAVLGGRAPRVLPVVQRVAVARRDELQRVARRHLEAVAGQPEIVDHLRAHHAGDVGGGRGAETRGDLLGDAGAADHVAPFEDAGAQAGARQQTGGHQAVVAAADDQRVPAGGRHQAMMGSSR